MKKIILLLIILICPQSALAYTELISFFIDDGVKSMSRGGLERLFLAPERTDFNSPFSINSDGKYRFDTGYEYQRTARVFDGSWSGSHAYSESIESSIAAPYSLWGDNVKGSLAVGYGSKSVDINVVSSKEDISVASKDSFDQVKAGLYLSVMQKATLGIAVIDSNFRSKLETPIEFEINPVESLRFGYKRVYRDFDGNFNLSVSGENGLIPVKFKDDSDELYVENTYGNILTLRYANELKQTQNRKILAKIKLPHDFYLAGYFAKRQFNINQDFYVDGSPGGFLGGVVKREDFRAGIGIDLPKWNIETNFRRQRLNSDGGGIADSSAVVSFWPSLIVGNYNYLYHAEVKSDSYQLGAEYTDKNFSFSMGGQYIDLKPVAVVDYWRSILFGLGRAGADTWQLKTDRIKLLFISLGIGYRWDKVSLQYAFGQFIPIDIHDTEQKTNSGGGGDGSSSDRVNIFDHNPGGNIQRVLLKILF